MLIENDTGKALDVRESKTAPDTPIIAYPKMGTDNQKWKYLNPELSVRINT